MTRINSVNMLRRSADLARRAESAERLSPLTEFIVVIDELCHIISGLIQITDVVRSLYGLRQAEEKVNQCKKEASEDTGNPQRSENCFDMEACLVDLAQRQIDYEELEASLTTRVVATSVSCQHNPQDLITLSREVDSSIIDLRYFTR